MPFVVCKVPMEHVQDTAGIEAAMREWNFGADDIIAVVAKTEGNGGVNDISRILVDRVLRDFLVAKGSRSRGRRRSGRATSISASTPSTIPAIPTAGPNTSRRSSGWRISRRKRASRAHRS